MSDLECPMEYPYPGGGYTKQSSLDGTPITTRYGSFCCKYPYDCFGNPLSIHSNCCQAGPDSTEGTGYIEGECHRDGEPNTNNARSGCNCKGGNFSIAGKEVSTHVGGTNTYNYWKGAPCTDSNKRSTRGKVCKTVVEGGRSRNICKSMTCQQLYNTVGQEWAALSPPISGVTLNDVKQGGCKKMGNLMTKFGDAADAEMSKNKYFRELATKIYSKIADDTMTYTERKQLLKTLEDEKILYTSIENKIKTELGWLDKSLEEMGDLMITNSRQLKNLIERVNTKNAEIKTMKEKIVAAKTKIQENKKIIEPHKASSFVSLLIFGIIMLCILFLSFKKYLLNVK